MHHLLKLFLGGGGRRERRLHSECSLAKSFTALYPHINQSMSKKSSKQGVVRRFFALAPICARTEYEKALCTGTLATHARERLEASVQLEGRSRNFPLFFTIERLQPHRLYLLNSQAVTYICFFFVYLSLINRSGFSQLLNSWDVESTSKE